MDELEVGDGVTVTDLRTGKRHHGVIEALHPDPFRGPDSRVIVRYDSGALVRVGPSFVRLDDGEGA